MPIYTKKGDQGQTSLANKTKLKKSSKRIEAIGTIDELNGFVGVALASGVPYDVEAELGNIQDDLFTIGSHLGASKLDISYLSNRVKAFEQEIDLMTELMPELTNFIHPSGSLASANIHVCRSLTRRSERRVVALQRENDEIKAMKPLVSFDEEVIEVDPLVLVYLNRLSDLFFTVARYCNFRAHRKDIIWKQHKPI